MIYVIINDTHFGLRRSNGTSFAALEGLEAEQTRALAAAVTHANNIGAALIILGDLFDSSKVSYSTLLKVWSILKDCAVPLYMVRGNHDLEKDRGQVSAFDLLCLMLGSPAVTEPLQLEPDCCILPHLDNQNSFDSALAAIPGGTLLAHCNYDNPFAVYQDHSLNLSPEQAVKFDHVILGHEHNKRDLPGIDILGAPYPCQIAECDITKGYHVWEGPGHELELQETYSPAGNYIEVDWHELAAVPTAAKFIRVTGTADFHEGAEVIQLVADLRKKHGAFFITNSVTVNGIELQAVEDAASSLDTFDALAMFWQLLKPETAERIHEAVDA